MQINGIEIEVEHKAIKNMHLSVYPPNGKVKVSAPLLYPEERIKLYLLQKWLGYFMNYSMYHNQHIPLMTGIKVSSVSKSSILSTKGAIPSKEEQIAITNILSDMDAEIIALKAKLEKYKKIKTGMMQQPLTGKIRLINNK